MKALSVRQPWADMIASGRKTVEVRSWTTAYRGPILICAAKRADAGGETLPRGVAVAVCDLVECRPLMPTDAGDAMCDYQPDHYAWVLSSPRPTTPLPVSGRLGLFSVAIEISERPDRDRTVASPLELERSTS